MACSRAPRIGRVQLGGSLMKLPENCPFAVLPTNPFDLISKERSNCCRPSLVGTEEPLCRSRATEDEAYRFIWHSSFDGAVMVHIASKREATALRWNYLRLRNGQACGTMVLSAAEWGRLHRTLDAAKFWSLDASGNRSGLDGADWLIEGRRKDIYHAVHRWSPCGEIHDLGRLFFAMALTPNLAVGGSLNEVLRKIVRVVSDRRSRYRSPRVN
jgi:hypothetical protein